MKAAYIAAAATVIFSVPAQAEEEFEGVYASATLGYDFQGNDSDEFISFDRGSNGSFAETVTTAAGANAFSPGFCDGEATSPQNSNCVSDSDGVTFSGRLGYDRQMGNLVMGLVAEAGTADLRDSVSAFSTTPAFYYMERKIDFTAALRLRAGFTPAKRTLLYATGGLAYAKLDQSFKTSNMANSFTVIPDKSAWGYQLGGGLEHKMSRKFSLGVEYLYTHYNSDNTLIRVGRGGAGATNPFVLAGGVDFKRGDDNVVLQTVRAIASYRF